MKLFWNNLADASASVLTASSADASYPVANVANGHLQKVWRTGTTLTEEYINIDFGSSVEFSAILLAAHDLTVDDLLRFKFSDSDVFTDAVEVGIDWTEETILAVFPPVTARYLRVMFTKGAAGQTRDIGRLFVGPHSDQDELPDDKGYREDPKDLSKIATSLGGQDWGEIRPQYRELQIRGTKLTEDDVQDLLDLDEHCGVVTPFFIQVQDPQGDLNAQPLDEVIYCRLKSLTGREHESSDTTLRWRVTLDLKEVI